MKDPAAGVVPLVRFADRWAVWILDGVHFRFVPVQVHLQGVMRPSAFAHGRLIPQGTLRGSRKSQCRVMIIIR